MIKVPSAEARLKSRDDLSQCKNVIVKVSAPELPGVRTKQARCPGRRAPCAPGRVPSGQAAARSRLAAWCAGHVLPAANAVAARLPPPSAHHTHPHPLFVVPDLWLCSWDRPSSHVRTRRAWPSAAWPPWWSRLRRSTARAATVSWWVRAADPLARRDARRRRSCESSCRALCTGRRAAALLLAVT